ncbi:MAG: hypothetical protein GWN87_05130, partial [Desulfuromonadales bacterium]|nr:hypothetical protein [Desulfuromonadales bacterium]
MAATGRIVSLTLNLRFDDGFVAWLNGAKIASVNDPAPLAWNSAATGPADETPARGNGVDFDISAHAGHLVVGENVLAIQLLNTDISSDDLLCLPTVTVSVARVPVGAIEFRQIESNPGS